LSQRYRALPYCLESLQPEKRMTLLYKIVPWIFPLLSVSFLAGCSTPGVTVTEPADLVVPTAVATQAVTLPTVTATGTVMPTAVATPTVTLPTVTATSTVASTAVATPTITLPTATATSTVAAPPSATPEFTLEAGGYRLLVYYAVPFPGTEQAAPPAGQEWIVVVARIDNVAGEPVEIGPESMTLVDAAGRRYRPDAPDDRTQPALVGARLTQGEGLLGLVRFTIPQGTAAGYLEWCPQEGEDCPRPLRAPIP
jgi:hypothetical protein